MSDAITRLMEGNLLAVFDERDPQRRAAAIATTYSPTVQWFDDEGVATGHQELDAKAAELQESSPACTSSPRDPSARPAAWGFWPGRCAPRMTPRWHRASTSRRSPRTASSSCGPS